jgi:hypothetical protein
VQKYPFPRIFNWCLWLSLDEAAKVSLLRLFGGLMHKDVVMDIYFCFKDKDLEAYKD